MYFSGIFIYLLLIQCIIYLLYIYIPRYILFNLGGIYINIIINLLNFMFCLDLQSKICECTSTNVLEFLDYFLLHGLPLGYNARSSER